MKQIRGTEESQNAVMENINELNDNEDKQITHFKDSKIETGNSISKGGNIAS
jgi:hypothetical protein